MVSKLWLGHLMKKVPLAGNQLDGLTFGAHRLPIVFPAQVQMTKEPHSSVEVKTRK
jgi:hypothetical protein